MSPQAQFGLLISFPWPLWSTNLSLTTLYRATMVVVHLGWVDSDLGSSPGPRPVGCYRSYVLPNRRVEHPKSKSTQPRCTTTMVTL